MPRLRAAALPVENEDTHATPRGRDVPTLAGHLAYNVLVRDVMRRSPVVIEPTATLWDALVQMRTHTISGLPVVDRSGALVGVLSQKDVASFLTVHSGLPPASTVLDVLLAPPADRSPPSLERYRILLEDSLVEQAMTQPPVFVGPDLPLESAMEKMAELQIHRLPVVDGYRLMGIVTTTDLLRAALRVRSHQI